jgi:hypothetical protein
MSLNSRLDKLESRAGIKDESNLIELVILWPDEDGGPIRVMVLPRCIEALNRIYGEQS